MAWGRAFRITVSSNDCVATDKLKLLQIKMNRKFSAWFRLLIFMKSCLCYWGIMYWENCAFLSVKSWVQYYHMSRNYRVLGEYLICRFVNRLLQVHLVFYQFVPRTLPLFQSNVRQHVLSKSGTVRVCILEHLIIVMFDSRLYVGSISQTVTGRVAKPMYSHKGTLLIRGQLSKSWNYCQ